MRIALLSQWFAPEPEFRVTLLARELARRGHQVVVLTGFPNYPEGKLYNGYKLKICQREEVDGYKLFRMFLYPDHSRTKIKRGLNYLSFAASAFLQGPILCGPIDLLWVYHPPLTVGIPAWWIGLLRRIPFVYEIQDMWPETLLATKMMRSGFAIRLLKSLSGFVYDRAAAISVISPGFKENLVYKGVPSGKIHVIPNWADEENMYPALRDAELGNRYGFTGRFNIIFSGNMGEAQALHKVIEAASNLTYLPDVQFTFIGDGTALEELKAQVKTQGLRNVQFLGRKPINQIASYHAWADALLVHLRDDPLFHITIPSKTIAYLACERPIICAVGGNAAEIVNQANAGLVCPPENATALANVVRQMYAMDPEQRQMMGQLGRRAFLEQYSRQISIEKFESLFEAVVDQRNYRRKCRPNSEHING